MVYRSLSATLSRKSVFHRAVDALTGAPAWVPVMDVAERESDYVVYTELPGVDPEQVDVAFEHSVLTIRGTKPASLRSRDRSEVRRFAAERVSGAFERSVRLPEFVDADRIEASFANGLLTVTLPKAAETKSRRIDVRSA